jgi:hypothetical protein
MRLRSTPAPLGIAAGALLAAALLAGCATVAPQDRLTAASAKTAEARSARMVATLKTSTGTPREPSGPLGGHSLDLSVEVDGVVDFANDRMRVTSKTDVAGAGFSTEMVLDGRGAAYIKSPLTATSGKPWLKIESPGDAPGLATPQLLTFPTDALAFLRDVSSEVREVGSEEVRGTPTTRYALTVDPRKVLDQQELTAEQRGRLRKALDEAKVRPFRADAWVDRDDRLRKLHYVIEPAASDAPRAESTLELFDFDAAGPVELPAASTVMTQTELERAVRERIGDFGKEGLEGLGDLGEELGKILEGAARKEDPTA